MTNQGQLKAAFGLVAIAALSSGATGCATSFTGSAHVENGRQGCEAKCRGVGMEVAGMVYMGEYSSACVCQAPGVTASGTRQLLLAAASGAAGGSVGVVMQQRRQQQQSNYGTFTY